MPENKIYGYLKEKNLTDLDEASWVAKYSEPENAKKVFSYFKEKQLTDLDETSFTDKYLKKKEPAIGLGYEKPSEALRMGGLPKQETISQSPLVTKPTTTKSVSTSPKFTKPQPRLSAEEQQASEIAASKGYVGQETEGTQLDVILANQKVQNIPLEKQMTSKEMTEQLDRMIPSTQGAEATQAFESIFKKPGREEELQGIDEVDFKKFLSATGVSDKFINAKMEYDLSDKERYSLIQKYNQSRAEKAVQDLKITKARLTSNPAFEQYQQMQEQASALQNEMGSMGIDENSAKVKSPEEIAQYNELVAQYNDMRQQAKLFAQESGIEADLMDLNEFLGNRDFALLGSRLLIDKYPNLLKEKQLQEKADAEYEERRARFKQGDLSVLPTSAMYVGASAINALNRNFYNSLAALIDNFGKLNDNTYSLGDWASKGLTELANNQIITPRKEFSKSGYNIDGYIVTKDASGSISVYEKDFTPVKVDPRMAARVSDEYDKKESKGADKETMYDFFSLTPQLADQFVTMYSLVGGGRLAQVGLQSLTKRAISQNTGLTASSYLMSYEDYKNSAIERGLSETDAHLFASLSAMTTSLLEGISPNENIIPKGQAAKALEAFTASVGSPIKTRMKAVAEALVVEPTKEILQEITQLGGDIVVETAANAALGKDVFDASTDMDEIRNTAVLTFGTTALAQLPTSQMFSTKDKKEWWQWASKDVDKLIAQVQEDVQNGLYSEEKAQIIVEKAKAWAATQGKIPAGTEDVKRAQITPLLMEKVELLETSKDLDKVFQDKVKKRIDAIDKEIVGIMNKPISEFTTEIETTTDGEGTIEGTVSTGTDVAEEGLGMATEPSGEGITGEGVQAETVPQAPVLEFEAPSINLAVPESPYNKSLRELGYADADIEKMTIEQKQNIAENKIEAPIVESTAKVDSTKENAKQERIAEMQAQLDQEAPPPTTGEVVSETVSEIEQPVVEQTTTDVGSEISPDVSEALRDVESTAKALGNIEKENPINFEETEKGFKITGGIIDAKIAAIKGDKISEVKTPSALSFLPKEIKLTHLSRNKKDKSSILKKGFDENMVSIDSPIQGIYFSSEDWSTMDRFGRAKEDIVYTTINNDGLLYFDSANGLRNFLKENKLPSEGQTLDKSQMEKLRQMGVKGILLREDFASQSRNELIVIDKSIIKKISENPDNITKLPSSFSDTKSIAEAYHADKAAGKETELTKAVESLLSKEQPTPTTQSESNPALRDVESTAKALEGLNKTATINGNKVKLIDIVNELSTRKSGGEYFVVTKNDPTSKGQKTTKEVYDYVNERINTNREIDKIQKVVESVRDAILKTDVEKVKSIIDNSNFNKDVLSVIQQFHYNNPEISISEAYHKAKADGSNPELVSAVEELLGTPSVSETTATETEVTPTEKKEVVSETVSEIEPPVVEQTTTDVGSEISPDVSEALSSVEKTSKVEEKGEKTLSAKKQPNKVAEKTLEADNTSSGVSDIGTTLPEGKKAFIPKKPKKKSALKELDPQTAEDFIALKLHGLKVKSKSFTDKVGAAYLTPQLRLTYLNKDKGVSINSIASDLISEGGVFANMDEQDVEQMVADFMISNPAGARQYANRKREDFKAEQLRYDEEAKYAENLALELAEQEKEAYYDEVNSAWDAIEEEIDSLSDEDFVRLQEQFIEDETNIDQYVNQIKDEKAINERRSKDTSKKESGRASSEQTKAKRKAIAAAPVDELANKAKDFANKYLASKGIDGVKKSGIGDQNKVIDIIAETVKTLINAGIEIDEAIKEVRAFFEAEYDTSELKDFEIKQKIARDELNDYAVEQGFSSYRHAVKAVNKYVREVGEEDVITKEEIDKAKEERAKEKEETVNESDGKAPKGQKLRGNYKTVIKYIQNIPDDVSDYLKQNPLTYQPIARKENLQFAKEYIIEQGEANGTPIAYTKFMNNEIGLEATPAQKVSIGYLLRGAFSEQYNEVSVLLGDAKTEGEQNELKATLEDLWGKQLSLANKLANDGTQYGQAVDAYSLFAQNLTDEISALFHFGKLTEKMAEKAKQNNKARAKNVKDKVSTTVKNGVKATAKEMGKAAKNYTPKKGRSGEAKKERDAAWNDVKSAFSKYRNMGAIYNPWEEAKKDKEAVKALTKYLKAELKYKSVQLQQVIKQVAELLNIDESFIDSESVQGIITEAQKGNDAEKVLAMAEKEAAKRAINEAKEVVSESKKQAKQNEKQLEKLAKEITNKPEVLETTFEQIIEDFYSDQLDTQGLVNLIKDRLEVTDAQAKQLASKLETLLKINVRDKISKQLDKQIDKAKPKDKKERKKQDIYQTLIRAQMMNVLNENTIQEIINSIFNIPSMTAEDIAFVKKTMAKYKQTGDPSRKAELLGKMVKRFNDKNPIAMSDVYDSFWYANVLSGFTTTGINITFGLGILEYAYMANFLLNAGKFTKALVGDGSVKEQLTRSGYNYWRSIFQTGTKTPSQILKPYQNEDTPLYETFNNVMSVMKYGPDVFLQEVKNLDYNKRAEFNLSDLSRGKNKLTILLLSGADIYRKSVPAILNSVDLAYSTTAKNLFLVPVLEDYYKEQGLSGSELTQAVENAIFNTQEEVAAAKLKAKADRKLIDITVEEKDGKWIVTDNAALFGKTKTFDTKEAADEHVEKISQEGTKFNKGVIDYLNAKIPKPSVDASRRIASRYLLTAEPEGALGYFYDKYITKWKINAQQAFQETSNPKLKRGFNFALDKMLVFLRVPFNMFNIAIDNSPLGFARYFSGNKILYDYKRAEYTTTERNLVLAHAMMGTAFLAYELFAQDILKIDDDDDEDKKAAEQKRKQELLELWNKKYPNEPIAIGNPIFELPKDGELFGSLGFLTPNQKQFLISNNLAAEYSRYNSKTNRFESYQASPNFMNFALVSGISNYEKYVINDNTKFTDRASKKKEFMEVVKWATSNMMTSYINLSGLKSQQQIISMFGSGKANENNLDKALELATSSIQLNPAIIKQSVANFDGVMRERIKPSEDFLKWTASKFVPIGGAFVKGEKMHDMFGQEMPMVYGSKQGGLLGYYFDIKFKEKELERTKIASYVYLNGYQRYRDFAKELKNKEVVAFENGEYVNKTLLDDKELKAVGVEAAKLANSLILENKDKLDQLTEFRLEEVDYKSPTLKTPFAKAVDGIFSAAFRYKWLEQSYNKGHLSKEAFNAEKENIKYIKYMLEGLDAKGKVLEDMGAESLVEFGYLKEE